MSGGVIQLVAKGAQDEWLTGEPQVSFFRSSFRRYTHYASSVERSVIAGNPTAGNISTVRLERKGDLVNYMYLIAKDTHGALVPSVAWNTVIDRVSLWIGGQMIDEQDITWMTQVEPITGAVTSSQRYLNDLSSPAQTNATSGFLPLKFFFNKDWKFSLPMIALQFHDVEVRITWASTLPVYQYEMWSNYIFLDEAERNFFSQSKMDMLISQVHRVPISPTNVMDISLAQPVKYLVFPSVVYSTVAQTTPDMSKYYLKTQINGTDVGDSRALFQYQDVSQYYHTPYGYMPNNTCPPVTIISYCLDTSATQPTGSLNFSRLDSFRLVAPTGSTISLLAGGARYLYAVNYNILRIEKGAGAVLYA